MNESTGCERVGARLDHLLDGELDAVEAARDRGHLEACVSCGRLVEIRRAELDALRRAMAPPAEEVAEVVNATLERLPTGNRRRLRRLRARPTLLSFATAAAAVLLLMLIDTFAMGSDALSISTRTESTSGRSWPPLRLTAPEIMLSAPTEEER